jgi:diguanylate cyclase (GGDEF)-like protein
MERRQLHRHELFWRPVIVVLRVLVAALLTWMLIANRRQRRERLHIASQDPLTGLPNRRCTANLARAVLDSAAVSLNPVTIALIDLVNLKRINARCGHDVGEYVLKEFARRARARLRTSAAIGRWGQQAFLLILPDVSIHAAVAMLAQLQAVTGEIPLPEAARDLKMTFNVGLASCSRTVPSMDEIIASAESALYEARQGGLNFWRLGHGSCRTATSPGLNALYAKPDAGRTAAREHRNRASTSGAGIATWHHARQAISDQRSCSNEQAKRVIYPLS